MYDSDFLHEKFPRPTNNEELLECEGDVYKTREQESSIL